MRKFIDRTGSWFNQFDAEDILARAAGLRRGCLDHVRVGGIYENGGVWFQRME